MRDHDGKPARVIVDEAVGGAVSRAHTFDVVGHSLLTLGIESAPSISNVVFGARPNPSKPNCLSRTTAPSMAARFAMTRLHSKTARSSFSRSGLALDAKSSHPTEAFDVVAATASKIWNSSVR